MQRWVAIVTASAAWIGLGAAIANGQAFLVQYEGNGGELSWNIQTNWNGDIYPDAAYHEGALLATSVSPPITAGIVYLDAPAATSVAELQVRGNKTLEIRSGGSLSVVETYADGEIEGNGTVTVTGSTAVAVEPGTATIRSGGSLSAHKVSIENDGTGAAVERSRLVVGDSTGGQATLTVNDTLTVIGRLELAGKNDIVQTDRLVLSGGSASFAGVYDVVIGATNTVVDAASEVRFSDGFLQMLDVDFDGVTPAAGDEWTLFDTGSINGTFDTIATDAPPPHPSQGYRFFTRPGGANGVLGKLALEQYLTLSVDQETGDVSIANQGPSAAVDIVAYNIQSTAGGLWPGSFQSLGGPWAPTSVTKNLIGEENAAGSSAFGAGASTPVGDFFNPYPRFAQPAVQDLVFSYEKANGDIVTGLVDYDDIPTVTNNLAVFLSCSGNAVITNDSLFAIDINGYSVSSDNGNLLTTWNSFEDQGIGTWEETASSEYLVGEVNPFGTLHLEPGESFELDGLFQGSQFDFEFEFALYAVNGELDQRVVDGYWWTFGCGVDGDFNDDGIVDNADYTVWRDNLGAADESSIHNNGDGLNGVDEADFTLWRMNWGNTLGAGGGAQAGGGCCGAGSAAASTAQSAVPEPASWAMLALGVAGVLVCFRPTAPRCFSL